MPTERELCLPSGEVVILRPGGVFSGLDLRGQGLQYLTLRGADFSGVHAEGVSFRGANLSGACFRNAKLHGADFTDALTQGASFEYADLSKAIATFITPPVDLFGANLEGLRSEGESHTLAQEILRRAAEGAAQERDSALLSKRLVAGLPLVMAEECANEFRQVIGDLRASSNPKDVVAVNWAVNTLRAQESWGFGWLPKADDEVCATDQEDAGCHPVCACGKPLCIHGRCPDFCTNEPCRKAREGG